MFMEDVKNDTCALYCDCGLTEGVLLKVDRDDNDIELSLVTDTYYINQLSYWERIKAKFRRILNILRNEEYEYFNIYICNEDDISKFKEFVQNI